MPELGVVDELGGDTVPLALLVGDVGVNVMGLWSLRVTTSLIFRGRLCCNWEFEELAGRESRRWFAGRSLLGGERGIIGSEERLALVICCLFGALTGKPWSSSTLRR